MMSKLPPGPALPADAGVEQDERAPDSSNDNGAQLERIEHALSRAPQAIAAITDAASKAEELLIRLESRFEETERRHDSLRKRAVDVDQICVKADRVQATLANFVDQFADVCDSSDAKITLLLDTVDSGAEAQAKLEEATTYAVEQAVRLEQSARDSDTAGQSADSPNPSQCVADDSAISSAIDSAMQSHLKRLDEVTERRLAEIESTFERQRSQLERDGDAVRAIASEIDERAKANAHEMENAARKHIDALASQTRSQEQVLDATSEQCAARMRKNGESIDRLDRITREHEERTKAFSSAQEERLAEIGIQCVERLEDAVKLNIEESKREFREALAPQLAHAANASERAAKAAENAQRLLDQLGELDERAGARIHELADAASKHIDQLESLTRSQEQVLSATTEQCVARMRKNFEAHDAEMRLHGESIERLERITRENDELTKASASAQDARLAEIGNLCVERLDDAFKLNLKEAKQEFNQALAPRLKDAAATVEQVAKSTERAQRLLGQLAALDQQADARTHELTSAAQNHLDQLNSLTRSQETVLGATAKQCVARMRKDFEAHDDKMRRHSESTERLERITQEHEERAKSSAIAQEERLTEIGQQCVEKLDVAFKLNLKKTKHEFNQDLAPKLKDAADVVERITNSTESARHSLDQLVERDERAQRQIESLAEKSKEASTAADTFESLKTEIQPSFDALSDCLAGSTATIDKIESLIPDVWTLTTTVQQRARQLTERCNEANTTGERIEELGREAEAHASTLAGQNLSARRRTEKLEKVTAGSEELFVRIENVYEDATKSVARVEHMAETTKTYHDALVQTLSSADGVIHELDHAVEKSAIADKGLTERNRRAEEITEALTRNVDASRPLVEELAASQTRGHEVAGEIEDSIDKAAKIRDDLATRTERAIQSSHETAQMLAALTERRELLEGSDETLREFLECAEQVRIKLHQTQTRADAFQHQLNSMLASPQKIVSDAKTQAAQLESVCAAVRKVFAGLSQASLQANRDITKFTKVSREANGRLTQISADTMRAGQSLREWVDEAVHVQARLAKSLAQAPPLTQTRSQLDHLARTTSGAIPEILQPPQHREFTGVRRPRGDTRGTAQDWLDSSIDYSAANNAEPVEDLTP